MRPSRADPWGHRLAHQESERGRDSHAAVGALIGLALLALAAGCNRRPLEDDAGGGTGHVGGDGGFDLLTDLGSDGSATEVGHDANAADTIADVESGAIPCGALTCTGMDLCLETAGCGGPLDCLMQAPDAGACPPGWHDNRFCASGCERDCPPPSFQCVPRPAACTNDVDCACVGPSFCPFGTCVGIQGRLAECGAV